MCILYIYVYIYIYISIYPPVDPHWDPFPRPRLLPFPGGQLSAFDRAEDSRHCKGKTNIRDGFAA